MTEAVGVAARRLVLVIALDRQGTRGVVERLRESGGQVPQPLDDGVPEWVARRHRRLLAEAGAHPLEPRPTRNIVSDDAVIEEIRSWLTVHFVGAPTLVVADPLMAWFEAAWTQAAGRLEATVDVVIVRPDEVAEVATAAGGGGAHGQSAESAYAGAVALLLRVAATSRSQPPLVVSTGTSGRPVTADGAPADLVRLGTRVLVAIGDPNSADVGELTADYARIYWANESLLAPPELPVAMPVAPFGDRSATPRRPRGLRRLVRAVGRRAVPSRRRRRARLWALDKADTAARAVLHALHR